MSDKILESFLRDQHTRAMALASSSDILFVAPDSTAFPQRYVVRFDCRSLTKVDGGEPKAEHAQFVFGIRLPDDYLRTPDLKQIVAVFRPWTIFHPNVAGPFICLGRLSGGTPLDDIIYQIYEIISYQKWSAHDGLNEEACQWARGHQEMFPLDRRPLKRREVKP